MARKIKSQITKTYQETTENGITRHAETITTTNKVFGTTTTTTAVIHDTTTGLYSHAFNSTLPDGRTTESGHMLTTEQGQSRIRIFRGEHAKHII